MLTPYQIPISPLLIPYQPISTPPVICAQQAAEAQWKNDPVGRRDKRHALCGGHESVAGYILVKAKGLDAAVDIAKQCPILQGGNRNSVEVRETVAA